MRVGVLDLLSTPALSWSEAAYDFVMTKQYASLTPQAISVWCRQRGHETHYAAYYGVGDPLRWFPDDLDVVFVATYSQASALAYALAKLWRRGGTRTVVGGPHAKAFPRDCARFFDLVVLDCNETLVEDIVRDRIPPGTIVTAARPFQEVPSVEERLPELRASAFARGRPYFSTTIPYLASVGCPYACDFCIDASTPYRQLPLDRLAADLRFVAAHFPGVMFGFHDPNFGVRFDDIMDVLESLPPRSRLPYIVESSLSVLRGRRIERLRRTNCGTLAPGVESWSSYSQKAGVGRATGREKVERLVAQFTVLHEHVPYLQANFMFGLDDDRGDEPVALTKEFMTRTPFVWPVVNIPHPFGGTPLHDALLRAGRILTPLPFSFYYSPYLATVPLHYDPVAYYEKLIDLFTHFTSPGMLARRLRAASAPFVRLVHVVRTRVKRRRLRAFRDLATRLRREPRFCAFHEGRSRELPEFYHREYERLLGPYAPLMSRDDRTPVLGDASAWVSC
jgi:radical SAM superfamily enzyme YgiQ (UPF0313 family)